MCIVFNRFVWTSRGQSIWTKSHIQWLLPKVKHSIRFFSLSVFVAITKRSVNWSKSVVSCNCHDNYSLQNGKIEATDIHIIECIENLVDNLCPVWHLFIYIQYHFKQKSSFEKFHVLLNIVAVHGQCNAAQINFNWSEFGFGFGKFALNSNREGKGQINSKNKWEKSNQSFHFVRETTCLSTPYFNWFHCIEVIDNFFVLWFFRCC